MIKYLQIIIIVLFSGGMAAAQEMIQFSQYFKSAQTFNPATTGINDYLDIKSGYRAQWSGFDGAPNTYFLTISGKIKPAGPGMNYMANSLRISDPSVYRTIPVRKPKHAVGGYLIADNYGPVNQYFGYLSYAYHLALTEKLNLSLGTSAGISNVNYKDELEVRNPGDNTFNGFIADGTARTKLDVNVGAFLYSPKFYIGYSATQLLQQRARLAGNAEGGKQYINHFAMAGYNIDLNPFFKLSPGILLKYVRPMPVALDVNLRLTYNDTFWGGVSYRNKDAFIGMLGFNISRQFNISYSYDYNTSDIGNYNSGSHEVVLGLMLGNNKKRTPYF